MVKSSSGKPDMRSFTVVDARRIDGCPTKFAIRGETGRYIGKDPRGAAAKAFTRLCRVKRIRGQCAMYLSVRETTQGASNPDKTFTYKLRRFKLPEPVEIRPGIMREYGTNIKSANGMPSECTTGKAKSAGPMMRRSAKKSNSASSSAGKGKRSKKSSKSSSSASKTHKAKKSKK